MRINVSRGSDPGGLCRYLLKEEKREPGREEENPIFHTNMVGRDAEELTEEFRFSADLNPRVQRIVTHYSISFPPGENPDIETKKAIADDLLEKQGHGRNCQYFAVEHFERQHKNDVHHFHIATSSIRLDGTWVDDSFDRLRIKQTERQLELRNGLTYCPSREKGERRNLTTGESRLEERTGQPCPKRKLWNSIDQATEDYPTMPTLVARVKADGYSARFSTFADGGRGISFEADGKTFQGRRLGDSYSFEGLQRYRGVDYLSERDDPILRELNTKTCEQCREYLEELQKPSPGTLEWVRAEFVLNYADTRLKKEKLTKIENDRYWAKRDPDTGIVVVGRQGEDEAIAQGKPAGFAWEISKAKVNLEDWREFAEQQQKQPLRELEQQKEIDQSRSQSRGGNGVER